MNESQKLALDRALKKKAAIQKAKNQKLASEKFSQQGVSAGGLNDVRDITDIDPFALSEAGLEVGTDAGRTGAVRQMAQGLTLGTADEIEALLKSFVGDGSFSEELSKISKDMAEYQKLSGGNATIQEIAGALMSPAGFLKMPKYFAQFSPAIQSAIRGMAGGAVYGTASAEGDVGERLEQGAMTAGAGFVLGGSMAKLANVVGNTKVANIVKRQQVAPTVENLKSARDAAYQAVDQKQLIIGAQDSANLLKRASEVANSFNYVTLKGAPTVVDRVKKMLEDKAGQGMTLGQSEEMRKALFKFTDDKQFGHIVRGIIDELDNVVNAKLAQTGDDSIKLARMAHQSYAKARTLEEAFNKAGNKVGGNNYNKYRSAVGSILNNPRQAKFFSEAEKETMEKFVAGSLPQNAMSFIGKFAPTTSGLMFALHTVSGFVSPWLIVGSIASSGAKLGLDKLTVNRAKKLVNKMGGAEKVKDMADRPLDATLNGYNADQVRDYILSDE